MISLQKVTVFDFITILFFIFLTIISFFVVYEKNTLSDSNFVVVQQNNKVVYNDDISKERELKFGNVVVEIKNKKVRIKESSCPYKICVHTGWISNPYQQIICVPNKTVVKIVNKYIKNSVDSITY